MFIRRNIMLGTGFSKFIDAYDQFAELSLSSTFRNVYFSFLVLFVSELVL